MDRTKVKDLIGELEAEVNNGGFDQYFYNSAGDNTADTIVALEAVGASRVADILRRAAAKFPAGMPPKDRTARQDLLLDHIADPDVFRELDDEFYKYPDDLAGLLKKYNAD